MDSKMDFKMVSKMVSKKSKMEIAKSLLGLGVNTVEQIAEVTKLSIEEVKKMFEEN